MNVQEILLRLERYEGRFPQVAIQEAIARRDEIIPALLGVLEDVARDPQPYASDGDRMVHLYAIYLLAQFRETRAYPLLTEIFSAPGELAFDLAGDMVTDDLGRILASVSDGAVGGMTSLVENEQANEYVRAAALEGLLTLVVWGKRSRDEIMAYFRGLFQKLDRTRSFVWDGLVNACADLCPEEVVEEIQQAYEDELVDSLIVAWEDIEDVLEAGKEAAMERLRRRRQPITDVVEEMGLWGCFHEDNRSVDAPAEPLPPPRFDFGWQETVRRTEPKVGPNDPCPCGSGKKFKKCCGKAAMR